MKNFLVIILVLLLIGTGITYAQIPGLWDAVRFGEWGVYLPCPPCSGIATVPIFVDNFESLVSMKFHLKWTGPIEICSVKFSSEINSYFENQLISIDTSNNVTTWELTDNVFPLPPGFRNIGYIVLSIYDTGTATIDTNRPPGDPDPPIQLVIPVGYFRLFSFYSPSFHLVQQNTRPGDANGDGITSLVDVIYLVNYIFKNGSEPANKQMMDVNLDCAVYLGDLIFLVNYIFKAGPKPLPSWCGDQPLPCPDHVNGEFVARVIDLGASWSPDGNSMVYRHIPVSAADSFGLYIFDTVTSMARYLGAAGLLADYPDWSPQGDWIVFESSGQIYKIKTNGDSLTQLTFSGENFFPEWSPDGSKIVYDRIDSVWMMDANSSNKKSIIRGRMPSFSPDGSKILFSGGIQLHLVDTTGSNEVVLTSLDGGGIRHPSFSPGGDKIVFQHQLSGERPDTWVINSDGTNLVRLTTDGGYAPSWSPDGSKIIYTNSCQYNGYLWLMNPDGTKKRQITFESLYK